jgi:hypothetical protein
VDLLDAQRSVLRAYTDPIFPIAEYKTAMGYRASMSIYTWFTNF